jgi:hypothetical protein
MEQSLADWREQWMVRLSRSLPDVSTFYKRLCDDIFLLDGWLSHSQLGVFLD